MTSRFFKDDIMNTFQTNPEINRYLVEKNIRLMNSAQLLQYLYQPSPTADRADVEHIFSSRMRVRAFKENIIQELSKLHQSMCPGIWNPYVHGATLDSIDPDDRDNDILVVVKNQSSPIAHPPNTSPTKKYISRKMKNVVGFVVVVTNHVYKEHKLDLICARMSGLSNLLIGCYLYIIKATPLYEQVGKLDLAGGYTNVNAYCSYRRMNFVTDYSEAALEKGSISLISMINDMSQYTSPEQIIHTIFHPTHSIDHYCVRTIPEEIKTYIYNTLIVRLLLSNAGFHQHDKPPSGVFTASTITHNLLTQEGLVIMFFLLLEPTERTQPYTPFEKYYRHLHDSDAAALVQLTSYTAFAEHFLIGCLGNKVHMDDYFTIKELADACESVIEQLITIPAPLPGLVQPKGRFTRRVRAALRRRPSQTPNQISASTIYHSYTGIHIADNIDHAALQALFFAEARTPVSETASITQTQAKLFKRNSSKHSLLRSVSSVDSQLSREDCVSQHRRTRKTAPVVDTTSCSRFSWWG